MNCRRCVQALDAMCKSTRRQFQLAPKRNHAMNEAEKTSRPPGVAVPWEEKIKQLPPMTGDKELVERVWKETDSLGYLYIYFCLLAF